MDTKEPIKFSDADGLALESDGSIALWINHETARSFGIISCPSGFTVGRYYHRGELRGYTVRRHRKQH